MNGRSWEGTSGRRSTNRTGPGSSSSATPFGRGGWAGARTIAAFAPPRFYLTQVGTFAATALAVAAVGLYAVAAYLVSRRTREIGLRIALGARAPEVLTMVVAETARPAALANLELAKRLSRLPVHRLVMDRDRERWRNVNRDLFPKDEFHVP